MYPCEPCLFHIVYYSHSGPLYAGAIPHLLADPLCYSLTSCHIYHSSGTLLARKMVFPVPWIFLRMGEDTWQNNPRNRRRSGMDWPTLLWDCWPGFMRSWLDGPTRTLGRTMKVGFQPLVLCFIRCLLCVCDSVDLDLCVPVFACRTSRLVADLL